MFVLLLVQLPTEKHHRQNLVKPSWLAEHWSAFQRAPVFPYHIMYSLDLYMDCSSSLPAPAVFAQWCVCSRRSHVFSLPTYFLRSSLSVSRYLGRDVKSPAYILL